MAGALYVPPVPVQVPDEPVALLLVQVKSKSGIGSPGRTVAESPVSDVRLEAMGSDTAASLAPYCVALDAAFHW